ncbi:lipocalin-like domain-containing protein [Chryseobacterium sp. POE27]|uniref:lipocalin-like domain-containing protein n=1 Tax=Chryseobacterium sp. POE27 TaxID=3138177 RepID=UPI0032198155
METTLFEKLVGTWTLVELIEVPVNGGEITRPMGKNPKGLIIYNPDGYMSAQIMNLNRSNFRQEHWINATAEEYTQEASTYLAYSGPFETDDEKQMVSHTMDVSLFPNWTGQTQKRIVTFIDGFLHLESEKPFISNSRLVTHQLIWKKVSN